MTIIQEKTHDLTTVNQQIENLREKIGKTNTDINTYIEKRDQLNQQVHILRQEIDELKKERDSLNESVKTLKQQRNEIRTSIQPYVDDIKAHSQKIRELKEKKPNAPRHQLQKQFDAIEWKIATTSLDLQEEKELIEEVKQLEVQLNVYKKMEQHSNRIREIKGDLKVYEDKADSLHQEMTSNAKRSQELHAQMQTKFEEMKKAREEANNLHQQFILAKAQVRAQHEEMSAVWGQRKQLITESRKQQDEVRKQIKAQDVATKKAKEQEIKQKIGSQARDKLERGEQVDWREFQLLSGDDSETED